MTKKHFIALAEVVRSQRPDVNAGDRVWQAWENFRDALLGFCQSQNPRFDRERWLGYIAGKCGPNGGKVGR